MNKGDNSKKSCVSLDSGFFNFADSSMMIPTFLDFKNNLNLFFSNDNVSKFVIINLVALLKT
jgi:hypothetical protein